MHIGSRRILQSFMGMAALIFFMGGFPGSAPAADTLFPVATGPLTIDSAVATALAENPDIGMARDAVKMARESVEATRALFRPTISLSGEYSAGDAPSAYLFKTIDQRELPLNTDFNDPGTFTNLEAGVTLQWNLYKGGRDHIDTRLARSGITAQTADRKTREDQVVSSVIDLFFAALKARDYVAIARQSVETVEEQLKIMKVRFRAGGLLKSDILSLKVRLASARQRWVESRNLYTTTLTALFNVMGRRVDDAAVLDDTCECPITFPDTVAAAHAVALEKRPEMARAATRINQARLSLERAQSGYLPRVDLQARYYLDNEDPAVDPDNSNYTAAVSMNWPIYTGGALASQCSRAALAVDQALKHKKKMALAVFQDVRRAYLNHQDAMQRYEVAKTSVEMAEESLLLVKKRYGGGSETVTRYLEAELARNQARINRATAFFDEKTALSDMARAMGVLSDIWTQEKQAQ